MSTPEYPDRTTIEAGQLEAALGRAAADLDVPDVVITLGPRGARWIATATGEATDVPGRKVTAVDTTGAGDTFAGYLAAGLSLGLAPRDAMIRATAAAALKVTKKGTADAIPPLSEVEAFLAAGD